MTLTTCAETRRNVESQASSSRKVTSAESPRKRAACGRSDASPVQQPSLERLIDAEHLTGGEGSQEASSRGPALKTAVPNLSAEGVTEVTPPVASKREKLTLDRRENQLELELEPESELDPKSRVHAFKPSMQSAEAGGSLSSSPTRAT